MVIRVTVIIIRSSGFGMMVGFSIIVLFKEINWCIDIGANKVAG